MTTTSQRTRKSSNGNKIKTNPVWSSQNASLEALGYTDEDFCKPDFSDLDYVSGFDFIEAFEQVPSIQPDDEVYYLDDDGIMRQGVFLNSYKRVRRNTYERKFNKSWQTAKYWQDEDSPYFSEQIEGIVRWVCVGTDGRIDYPLAIEVFHPMEIERSHYALMVIETATL